ncbi:hypothetical protein M2404_000880 [Rheinheimera pacifica]|nr:hypothetical protein [Rheinheimera pacifica]
MLTNSSGTNLNSSAGPQGELQDEVHPAGLHGRIYGVLVWVSLFVFKAVF